MASGVRIFIATSRDGFIAGPDDDLSWLPDGHGGEDYGYDAFMAETDVLLMGRRTHDVVQGFGIDWPYGDTPVLVATRRPLESDEPSVRAVAGTPAELLAAAREVGPGIYLDGGDLIQQFLDADLVDEATITVIPVDLGGGIPLFTTDAQRERLGLADRRVFPSGVEQRYFTRA